MLKGMGLRAAATRSTRGGSAPGLGARLHPAAPRSGPALRRAPTSAARAPTHPGKREPSLLVGSAGTDAGPREPHAWPRPWGSLPGGTSGCIRGNAMP